MPIKYELAYGGTYHSEDGEVRYEPNPVGRGFVDLRRIGRDTFIPAPQVELPDEPIRGLDRQYQPAGFGPVAKHCLPRRRLCGTPDEKWKAERWPRRPLDFDFTYYNCASDGLRYHGMLKGDENVVLDGLAAEGQIAFRLPGLDLLVFSVDRRDRLSLTPLVLDTLHIDCQKRSVGLTWRATCVRQDNVATLQYTPR